MLTAKLQATPATIPVSRQRLPAAAVAIGLFIVLASSTTAMTGPASSDAPVVSLATLGQQLVTTLILPFEVISLIFVAAMVGAIALVARKPTTPSP